MTRRYDVLYGEHGPFVDFHFCREWDETGGCYGARPDHGMSWEEAAEEMATYFSALARAWSETTEEEWLRSRVGKFSPQPLGGG